MGAPKYKTTATSNKYDSVSEKQSPSTSLKVEISQLQELIKKKLNNPSMAKKAAQIIEEMLKDQPKK